MDLFRAKEIASMYQLQRIEYQSNYMRDEIQRQIQPEQYYKFLTSQSIPFQLPNNINKYSVLPFQSGQRSIKYYDALEYPFTALGLLLIQNQSCSIIQIGAIFKQNYVIATLSREAFQLGQDVLLTFYPAFNLNRYTHSCKAKIFAFRKASKNVLLQLQFQGSMQMIFGKIAIQTNFDLSSLNQRPRNQEGQRRRGRRGEDRVPRRPQDDQIVNPNEISIFYYRFERQQVQLTSKKVPASQFDEWLPNCGLSGICFKFENNKYLLIGTVSNNQFTNVGFQDLEEFSKTFNREKFQLDCEQMGLEEKQCIWIFQKKWQNLVRVNLNKNRVNKSLCGYLSTAVWPQIKQLNLSLNPIGPIGILRLTQASFPHLQVVNLRNTLMEDGGCEKLSRSNWLPLRELNIANNSIREQGCKWISCANWPNLKHLNIQKNKIRGEGCKHLINSQWNLQKLQLSDCFIDDIGCKWLIRSKWTSLTCIDLQNNSITNLGCKWLRKGNWKNITRFLIAKNPKISKQGFEYISKMNFSNIYEISVNLDYQCLFSNYYFLKGQFPYLCIINTNQYSRGRFRRNNSQDYLQKVDVYLKTKFKYFVKANE